MFIYIYIYVFSIHLVDRNRRIAVYRTVNRTLNDNDPSANIDCESLFSTNEFFPIPYVTVHKCKLIAQNFYTQRPSKNGEKLKKKKKMKVSLRNEISRKSYSNIIIYNKYI